jgi:hypothetical protein
MLKKKVAQNVINSLGSFIFTKNHTEIPKVSKLAKNSQFGHPVKHARSWRKRNNNSQSSHWEQKSYLGRKNMTTEPTEI